MKTRVNPKNKVCYILSYKAPDYIRTRVLTKALADIDSVELYLAINSRRSPLRYLQTLWRLILVRFKHRPDLYILGFRGQEIFWPVRLITIGKPLVFDEFINMHDWLGDENDKLPGWLLKLADWYEALALKASRMVLSDTELGAKKSAETYNIAAAKFRTIYVGADEALFKPRRSAPKNKDLEVFFYGNLAPLHGLNLILEAAALLKEKPVHFMVIGGRGRLREIKTIRRFIKDRGLDNVTHREWLNFEDIPAQMAASDLFLGGPFGDTSQARRVITGKTFQALAIGVPTLVGRINENVEFKDKQNCLLVKQGSAKALADAITWAADNRTRLPAIGLAGRQLFEQRFATAILTRELKIIVDQALSKADNQYNW